MARTPQEMREAIARNLPEKTGRSLEEWVELVRAQGPEARKDRVAWLKQEYKLGHGQASTVAEAAAKPIGYAELTPEERLAAQYEGPKAALRPIFDKLLTAVKELGNDITVNPLQTYTAIIRRRQFALIQPSTGTRVDLGLVLPGIEQTPRLQTAGGLGNVRTTHRVALESPDDVDDEVLGWLKVAYDLDTSPR